MITTPEKTQLNFDLNRSIEILERTPKVIEVLLDGLSEEWTHVNEGGDTWSAFDIVGHLIHGESTDWITRINIILNQDGDRKFKSFDRFAQFEESKGKTLKQLLEEFKKVRKENLEKLKKLNLSSSDFNKKGIHPVFGEVTLHQLISTWTAHDLGHLAQIARVMAKQYKDDIGPWKEYLRIVRE